MIFISLLKIRKRLLENRGAFLLFNKVELKTHDRRKICKEYEPRLNQPNFMMLSLNVIFSEL